MLMVLRNLPSSVYRSISREHSSDDSNDGIIANPDECNSFCTRCQSIFLFIFTLIYAMITRSLNNINPELADICPVIKQRFTNIA